MGWVFIQLMHRSAGVLGLTASKLHIALLRRLLDDFFSLFKRQRMLEPIPVHRAHIIHADRRDGLHSRVDLGRADDEAPAAANPQNTDAILSTNGRVPRKSTAALKSSA